MAFRNKAQYILAHKPDILIVPECEHPDKLKYKPGLPASTDILWFGKNQHKGLGIFSYSKFRFKVLANHNEDLRMIIPVAVSDGHFSFTLFAVWAWNPDDPDGRYVEQVWKAINYYEGILTNEGTILIGDFNSNTIWDKKYRVGNHSTVVEKLAEKGIHSVYHRHFNQVQGKEKHPTLYLYRHKNKPYHIDYCFASEDLIGKLKSVEIGEHRQWKKYSDHVPVIVSFIL